jgi:hypothetical protein
MMGIVEQRSFWVSDIRYLNDSEELRHLGRWLNGTAGRREQTEGPQKVLTQFREWLRHRLLIDFGPTLFVGSFTERGNLLSQWRGYCQHGRGVSIGFNPFKMIEYTQRHSFMIGRCIYDRQAKSDLAEQVINTIISTAESNGESSELHPCQSYHGIFREIEPELLRIATLVKDDSFHEEKEWRVVSPVFSNYIEPPIKFREGSSMLIPYMELPLGDSGQKIQIEEIFVGPTPYEPVNGVTKPLSEPIRDVWENRKLRNPLSKFIDEVMILAFPGPALVAVDDVVEYAFMGTDPNSADNRWLLDAMQRQIPVIYFLGLRPVGISPSSRHSLSGGTPSPSESRLLSGRS